VIFNAEIAEIAEENASTRRNGETEINKGFNASIDSGASGPRATRALNVSDQIDPFVSVFLLLCVKNSLRSLRSLR
jgi:hypothetical protein